MFNANHNSRLKLLAISIYYFLFLALIFSSQPSLQQDHPPLKSEPFTLDLYHKFNINQEFKLRASVLVKPKTEYRVATASLANQAELSEADLVALKESSATNDNYYLRASVRRRESDKGGALLKSTQTLIKACSLVSSNLVDFITVNLSPSNDFLNINLFTPDQECQGEPPRQFANKFNTTVLVESAGLGPVPDTATYIKRLEEERRNKQSQGKQDDRSFFAKYWYYIVPNQAELSEADLVALKESSATNDNYYLRASVRRRESDKGGALLKSTQTLIKACSLVSSNLVDFITVNLSPSNDFLNINLFTPDQECQGEPPRQFANKFNTTVLVESAGLGPVPDTATYIKRLEEERRNKQSQGKQDDRSFFAKYWYYIVPGVILLMVFSGPEQGSR